MFPSYYWKVGSSLRWRRFSHWLHRSPKRASTSSHHCLHEEEETSNVEHLMKTSSVLTASAGSCHTLDLSVAGQSYTCKYDRLLSLRRVHKNTFLDDIVVKVLVMYLKIIYFTVHSTHCRWKRQSSMPKRRESKLWRMRDTCSRNTSCWRSRWTHFGRASVSTRCQTAYVLEIVPQR